MAALVQIPFQRRLPYLRARRVAAIDAGSATLKFILVEHAFGRIRVLRHESLELGEEGLVSPEDLARHLQLALRGVDYDQIAIVLSQHRSLSQVIDLPTDADEQQFIQREIVKLSGLSDSALIYDYSRLKPFGNFRNPFWVTLCQENEARAQIHRLAAPKEDLCEITSGANALIAAFQLHQPDWTEPALLVDLGAASTTVALQIEGQGVHATALPIGSDTFTEAVARAQQIATAEAEAAKRSENQFTNGSSSLIEAVQAWTSELERVVSDWAKEHPGAAPRTPTVFLCGAGALQPGLIDHLNERSPFSVRPWPQTGRLSSPQFVAAYGTALCALGCYQQSASLLPRDVREHSQKQQTLQRLQFANFGLILLVALVLVFGTWQKLSLLNTKNRLLAEANTALAQAKSAQTIMAQLVQEYEGLRPVLERQRFTLDSLTALKALQQAQTTQAFWYVLISDQASYFAPLPPGTNAPATNGPTELVVRTSTPPPRSGLIAELCLPKNGDAAGLALSQIATNLRQAPVFRNVDSLPINRARNWVDPKVTLPDRCVALTLELAENEYQRPLPWKSSPVSLPAREPRTSPLTFKQRVDRPGIPPIADP